MSSGEPSQWVFSLDDPTELDEKLAALVDEAADLRFSQELPGAESSTHHIVEATVLTRRRLDRLEQIVGTLTRARTRASEKVQKAQDDLDDSWARAATQRRGNFAVSEPAPRERYALYDSECTEDKMALRTAQRDLGRIEEALEISRNCLYGLRGVRDDLSSISRLLTTTSLIER